MLKFYNDGLKDCSWIPDTYDEFVKYCSTKKVETDGDLLLIANGDEEFKYIDTIYVLKDRRGKGLATEKLKSLSGRCVLICNKRLTNFYKSLGFTNDLLYDILVRENR